MPGSDGDAADVEFGDLEGKRGMRRKGGIDSKKEEFKRDRFPNNSPDQSILVLTFIETSLGILIGRISMLSRAAGNTRGTKTDRNGQDGGKGVLFWSEEVTLLSKASYGTCENNTAGIFDTFETQRKGVKGKPKCLPEQGDHPQEQRET